MPTASLNEIQKLKSVLAHVLRRMQTDQGFREVMMGTALCVDVVEHLCLVEGAERPIGWETGICDPGTVLEVLRKAVTDKRVHQESVDANTKSKSPRSWIKVEEDLPDEETTVLMAMDDGEIWSGYLDTGSWRYESGQPVGDYVVTHWMDLPEPPETNHEKGGA